MKIGIICATPHLQRFSLQSTFHLILPHLYTQFPAYREFYAERIRQGDFVTQDTAVFELEESLPGPQLIDMAESLGVSEMVTPEVLLSAEQSKVKLEEFLTHRQKVGSKLPLLSVVQGTSLEELFRYWAYLLNLDEVSTIGVPFDIDFDMYVTRGVRSPTLRRVLNRVEIVRMAEKSNLLRKPVHLLGLADGVELQFYKHPMIRSNDSSSAFVHGAEMIYYTDRGLPQEKIKTKLDFGRVLTQPKQFDAINHNITMLKAFAGAE